MLGQVFGGLAGLPGMFANFLSGIVDAITGTVTTVVDDGLNAISDFFNGIGDAIGGFVDTVLQGLGVITSGTTIPPNQIPSIGPNSDPNVQQDPSFVTPKSVQGQGLWAWDWPGPDGGNWDNSGGCIRTVRTNLITIYWVTGVWDQLVGTTVVAPNDPDLGDVAVKLKRLVSDRSVAEADWLAASAAAATTVPMTEGANLIDWERFEVIFVPYPGALYPMGFSTDQGVTNLTNEIKSRPGKFILMGGSLGGIVVSRVFQDIINPTGTLHSRNADLLMGWAGASPMRAEGATWPGNPLPVSPGHGCLKDNLHTTDPRWWEWSATHAGSYPAFGDPAGITWPNADPISCLGDDSLSKDVRDLVDSSYSHKAITPNDSGDFFLLMLGAFFSAAGNVLLNIGFNATQSPHALSWWVIQPFLSTGDERSFWHYTFDYINETFAPLVSPPTIGIHHQMEGTRFPVQSLSVVHGKVHVKWMNVVASGPAIMMACNAYDASGKLILGPGGVSPTVTFTGSTISDPTSDADWQLLEASFVVPTGSVSACLVFDVSPEAMTTGIVWFGKSEFQVTNRIDAALFTNMADFPGILATQVAGVAGQADMLTSIQNLIDGATSANAGVPLTDVQLAQLFNTMGVTAGNAASALALAVAHEQTLTLPTNEPVYGGLSPTGEVTFELQTLPQGSTMPTTDITAGTAMAGFITCKKAAVKGFIEFLAFGGGSTTSTYVNVYNVDQTTGNWTNLWSSADISASIPNGTAGWVGVDIPDGHEIPVIQGQLLAVEIVAQGTTISVVSKTTGLPDRAGVPVNYGAARTTAVSGGVSPASLSVGTPTYSSTFPFVALGLRNIPPLFQPPNTTQFDLVGTHIYDIPDWAQTDGTLFDIVAVGGGGAGFPGDIFTAPRGGRPGAWAAGTYVYGTDIPSATTQLITIVGQGGPATSSNNFPGGKSVVGYAPVTPAWDATGAGAGGNNTTSLTWSHTATAGAYVVVAVNVFNDHATSVTYGGVAMTPIGAGVSGDFTFLRLYGLAGVAGGAKTVLVSMPFVSAAAANSVSYTGVATVGTVQAIASGQPVDCPLGATIVAAFGSDGNAFTSTTGGTNRWNFNPGIVGISAPTSISDSTVGDIFTVTGGFRTPVGLAVSLFATGGTTILNAAGGAAEAHTGGGVGAGNETYNGKNYFGGNDVATGPGAFPGGGAASGAGANGEVWITARRL